MHIFRQQKHVQYWIKEIYVLVIFSKEIYVRSNDIVQKDWTFYALLQKIDKIIQQHSL